MIFLQIRHSISVLIIIIKKKSLIKTRKARLRIFLWIVSNFITNTVSSLLWLIDSVFYPEYKLINIKRIAIILGQPRSGTTFLQRQLCKDKSNFTGVPHFFWRFPSIFLYKLLKKTNLLEYFNSIPYWSQKRGSIANKMHSHVLGDVEEDGIFLEEKFWSHFFIFRRIPIPEILPLIDDWERFDQIKKNKIIKIHKQILNKWKIINSCEENVTFILKENDATDFVKYFISKNTDVTIIFLAREPKEFLDSYLELSIQSTYSKIGLNPININNWFRACIEKRITESKKQINLLKTHKDLIISLNFKNLTLDPLNSIFKIYNELKIKLDLEYIQELENLNKIQSRRDKGYNNKSYNIDLKDFNDYSNYIEQHKKQ
ncbi:sulfotransferase [Winogradskyella flava]|uniref:Sulfotransferase n=1 Tax=Winogradskyella flava TaxID=1884876 RepID=A0A842J0J1_9FLAO|nr:sulfotransferase [Winogradskyella flava]MBC2846488.1 sulfotransferase [Winogradskyella flava]